MNRRSSPGHLATLSEPAPLSISAGLEAYAEPLDALHAAHLLRRAGFGVPSDALAASIGQQAAFVVGELVEEARIAAMPPKPDWADEAPPPRSAPASERERYNRNNTGWRNEWSSIWFTEMHRLGLRERMTLFWHNHFATEYRVYNLAVYAYRQTTTLRRHALGNVKDLVRDVGLEPAMLLYLNGAQNVVGAPNENYARELLELFTMGPFDQYGNENYTQTDIEEIARALTGWRVNRNLLTVVFRTGRFDFGDKTIFGRTGRWGYNDVIDILFEERAEQIAAFIARKLYREFVYAAPDDAVVADLAQVFLDNDFEIAPVVSALLSSAHFFDEQVIGARIISPVEMIVGLMRDLDAAAVPAVMGRLRRFSSRLGQALFNPPNVAGWPGHRTWLTTTTLTERWRVAEQLMNRLTNDGALDLPALAEKLHDPNDVFATFNLPVALAERLLPVSLDLLDLSTDGLEFTGDLVNRPIPRVVQNGPAHVRNLAKLFLGGLPWYEWHLGRPNAAAVLRRYIITLTNLPEFQLT